MTRPSRNTDRLLLDAGKELLPKTGISGLKVRDVAHRAGVNLGMFNYHFKTKDRFIECLLAEIYEEFFANFSLEVKEGATCREQLRSAVIAIARFVRAHRPLLAVFIEEIMMGNRAILAFAKKNMTRHITIVFGLVRACQKQGYIVKIPVISVLSFIIASVVGPNIVIRGLEKFQSGGIVSKVFIKQLDRMLLSDTAIVQRIDIALKGLTPGE